ncbi:uncharacterized protein LOC113146870 [Cyclospora cayetanensis]|uniref:Uncharacterized protein LOC113146870 n=1 Tax=Cyclospora cayetanensis TaxID=88456 RepID=A0A6P6RUW5_9EIME|nr:uncharacterized protein LOC113146870 [Cyclospora cayetanensis]
MRQALEDHFLKIVEHQAVLGIQGERLLRLAATHHEVETGNTDKCSGNPTHAGGSSSNSSSRRRQSMDCMADGSKYSSSECSTRPYPTSAAACGGGGQALMSQLAGTVDSTATSTADVQGSGARSTSTPSHGRLNPTAAAHAATSAGVAAAIAAEAAAAATEAMATRATLYAQTLGRPGEDLQAARCRTNMPFQPPAPALHDEILQGICDAHCGSPRSSGGFARARSAATATGELAGGSAGAVCKDGGFAMSVS